ncbi:MAG: DUF4421 family protein [Bacteroidia bacterium]|nr:DUF4421 family protein [Bacteroidia bacterium]
MKNLLLIIALLFTILTANADANVEKYTTWLGVKLYFTSNGLRYTIKDNNKPSIRKTFTANYPLALGMQVTVANFSLGYTFGGTQQWFNSAQKLKNSSKYWGLELNYMTNKLVFENQINSFGQFSVNSNCNCTQLVSASKSINSNYIDPLLKSFELSSNVQYIFNGNKWSYKALQNNGAKQVKSAGSFIAMMEYNYRQIRSTTDYIINQTPTKTDFDKYNLTKKMQASSPSLSVGYGYTLAYKSFYVGGIAYAGSGWLINRVKILSTSTSNDNFSFNGRLKANAGFNGKRFYFGFSSNFATINNNIKNELRSNWLNYEYNFYIGMRIATRKLF